jgi:hypothetical protein
MSLNPAKLPGFLKSQASITIQPEKVKCSNAANRSATCLSSGTSNDARQHGLLQHIRPEHHAAATTGYSVRPP